MAVFHDQHRIASGPLPPAHRRATGLVRPADRAGRGTKALREMERGLMFVMAISDGSSLAVLAAPDCDTDLVAYEMSLLVEAVGDVLTPAARGPRGLLAGQVTAGGGRPGLRPA